MLRKNTKLHRIEFAVFRAPPIQLSPGTRVLAAVSGGADSIAMLHVLSRLQVRWAFDLEVVHVHHGGSASEVTRKFRDRAARKVEAIARSLGQPFHLLPLKAIRAESEASLRDGRFAALEEFASRTKSESKTDVIVLGHHRDDLFETRLIRLMRGTGAAGLCAMTPISKTAEGTLLWRPFLDFQRREIEAYLTDIGLKKNRDWLNDPSNRDARYLRNAIRKKLIPMLEELRPGSSTSMARSLELLCEFVAESDQIGRFEWSTKSELNRGSLLELSLARRRVALAKWMDSLGIRDFSRAHVDEMLKRIDTRRKRLSFEMCGRVWLVEKTIRLAPAEALSH